ncbi:hypothetical protein [Nostoc sp.]|uniref:hypothetical protein n=1 Tax=Nostoc sp. TaxID=1180 RepID=UPI002FFD3497
MTISLKGSNLPPKYLAINSSAIAKKCNRFSGLAKPCPFDRFLIVSPVDRLHLDR